MLKNKVKSILILSLFAPSLAFASSGFNVSGFSDPLVNGKYCDTNTTYNSQTVYSKTGMKYFFGFDGGADLYWAFGTVTEPYNGATWYYYGVPHNPDPTSFIYFQGVQQNVQETPTITATTCSDGSSSNLAFISAASNGFASTTGFTVGSVVSFAGENFYKLFIGSGTLVIYSIRYWIMALIIIYLSVFFAFRALKFYRH